MSHLISINYLMSWTEERSRILADQARNGNGDAVHVIECLLGYCNDVSELTEHEFRRSVLKYCARHSIPI